MIRLDLKGDATLVIFYGEGDFGVPDGNVDIELRLSSGERYSATLFTLSNIKVLLEMYQKTGENLSGLYFQCPDAVIIRDILPETILDWMQHLRKEGLVQDVLSPLGPDEESEATGE